MEVSWIDPIALSVTSSIYHSALECIWSVDNDMVRSRNCTEFYTRIYSIARCKRYFFGGRTFVHRALFYVCQVNSIFLIGRFSLLSCKFTKKTWYKYYFYVDFCTFDSWFGQMPGGKMPYHHFFEELCDEKMQWS